MAQTCPACHSELQGRGKQRYCGSCGEAIDVEVDRERIRRDTTGFLGRRELSRIVDSMNDSSATHHEYTHVHIQEEVRHALWELAILTCWDDFDNREALLGDLVRSAPGELDEDRELRETKVVVSLFEFLFTSLTIPAFEQLLELAIRQAASDPDSGEVPEVDLEIRLNGHSTEEIDEKLEEMRMSSDGG